MQTRTLCPRARSRAQRGATAVRRTGVASKIIGDQFVLNGELQGVTVNRKPSKTWKSFADQDTPLIYCIRGASTSPYAKKMVRDPT